MTLQVCEPSPVISNAPLSGVFVGNATPSTEYTYEVEVVTLTVTVPLNQPLVMAGPVGVAVRTLAGGVGSCTGGCRLSSKLSALLVAKPTLPAWSLAWTMNSTLFVPEASANEPVHRVVPGVRTRSTPVHAFARPSPGFWAVYDYPLYE